MKKIVAFLLSVLLLIGIGGCSSKKDVAEIEKILTDNNYKIGVANTGIHVFILDNENPLHGWTIEDSDKISYQNSDIESIIIDVKTGDYTEISIYKEVNGEKGEYIRNLSDPDATKNAMAKIKDDSEQALKAMNITIEDLISLYKDKIENYDPDKVESDNVDNTIEQTKESDVKKYYTIATTITKDQLTKDNLGLYSYNDIKFTTDDCDWIDSAMNKEGTVNQGAFYRKMATSLDGFNQGYNNGSKFSEHILGFKTSSKEEFTTYAADLSAYIVEKDSLKPVMNKFKSLSTITGTINIDANSYDFTITDLTACANELKISEEMLGYILAMLDEYAPTVSFEDNSYSFKLS